MLRPEVAGTETATRFQARAASALDARLVLVLEPGEQPWRMKAWPVEVFVSDQLAAWVHPDVRGFAYPSTREPRRDPR
jgi:hypothetical protein